jgi:Putative peptidoglycan binding domain
MRLIKSLLVGLVLAGMLAMISTPAAFAHGGGGGGHGGGFGGGHGGSFGGRGHFGGGHFGGFAGHGFASHEGERFAPQHSFRGHYRYGRPYSYGDPFWYDYPYYGYYDYDDGNYSDAQASPSEPGAAEQTNIAVQQELAKRGFYQGPIDGSVGPETRKAISWFQSVEKLTVTGRVDGPTLEALQIR